MKSNLPKATKEEAKLAFRVRTETRTCILACLLDCLCDYRGRGVFVSPVHIGVMQVSKYVSDHPPLGS